MVNPQPTQAADTPTTDVGFVPAIRSRKAIALFVAIFAVLLAGDLALKAWSFRGALPTESYSQTIPPEGRTLIPRILALRLTWNPGAIFGSMQGRKWFFVVASIVAAGMILWFFTQTHARERTTQVGLALILAGAMGNLYDRLAFGFVRDMLLLFPDVKLPFGLRWPGGAQDVYPWIFNPADVFLLIGIGVVLIRSFFIKDPTQHTPTEPRA